MSPAATARQAALRRAATSTGATLALTAIVVGGASPAHADARYTVRSGDTVSHIAQRAGTSVAAIAAANALADASRIYAGQVLTIPTAVTASSSVPAAPPAPAPTTTTYTVVAGDTVGAIAARYGTTVPAVIAANGLNSRALVRIGQALTIPVTIPVAGAATSTTAAVQPVAATTYTVVAGDTVSAIAARYGTTVPAVVVANDLGPRALIRVGQALTIPSSFAAALGTALVGDTFAGRTYPATVVASANANKAALLAAGVPSAAQMRTLVADTARSMSVDPALAQAVAFQESGFNHDSVSAANAIGTMQVIPSSGEWASQLVGRSLNLMDPRDNVVAGVAILRSLVRTSPDLPTAIAAYYQGTGSVLRNGMYADTRRYVANVQALVSRFS